MLHSFWIPVRKPLLSYCSKLHWSSVSRHTICKEMLKEMKKFFSSRYLSHSKAFGHFNASKTSIRHAFRVEADSAIFKTFKCVRTIRVEFKSIHLANSDCLGCLSGWFGYLKIRTDNSFLPVSNRELNSEFLNVQIEHTRTFRGFLFVVA